MQAYKGLLIWAITALVIGCTRTVNVDKERDALLAADRQASEASADLSKLLLFYAADASVYPQGMAIATGSDAIKAFFTAAMSAPNMSLHWTPAKAEVGAAGDMGYTSGAYELNANGTTEKGKYVTVWKKQGDGSWKIAEDIFNADASAQAPPSEHKMVLPNALTWSDAPPGLPRGAKMAVLSGDPSKPGLFVLRVQLPAGYTVAAHWHPSDEAVTVLSGTFALGMGDKLDPQKLESLPVGGYALLPAKMGHYAMAKTAAVIQIHAMGPFAINYVNPADDPRKQVKQ